jgi:hypothetical protein
VVEAIRDLCPSGDSGDELRCLLARFDTRDAERLRAFMAENPPRTEQQGDAA